MSHPAFTPRRRASPHFGRYFFLVPQRVRGGVGLSGWLHTEVVCHLDFFQRKCWWISLCRPIRTESSLLRYVHWVPRMCWILLERSVYWQRWVISCQSTGVRYKLGLL